jgi:predicted nucleic acid-binding protein
VKAFFDTSALVPVFFEDHPRHERSFGLFSSQRKSAACTGAHCLAEFYSTATGLLGRKQASPQNAWQFLNAIRERLTIIILDEADYVAVLDEAVQGGISGGAIYDALIARFALKAKAQIIYTWNARHFQRFGPEIAARVREPGAA